MERSDAPDHVQRRRPLFLIYLAAVLLTVPLFLLIYPLVPEIRLPHGAGLRVDHVVSFLSVFILLVFIVKRFAGVIRVSVILLFLGALVSGLLNGPGIQGVYRSYAHALKGIRTKAVHVPLMLDPEPFHNAVALRGAIDVLDPALRKFAVTAAVAHFQDREVEPGEFTLVQSFSIFKEINGRWRYVSDLKGGEYFAKASESAALLAGDCDDHAVLMVACLKAVGSEARLVRTTGHVYPELMIGDAKAMERAAFLIRKVLFAAEVGDAPLHYHIDPDGRHWINMDYTRRYPGGELMHEPIIGIMEI